MTKVSSKVLALCAIANTASAFFVPQGFIGRGHTSVCSYLDNIGSGKAETKVSASASSAPPDLKKGPSGPLTQPAGKSGDLQRWDDLWDGLTPVRVQGGGALKTWSYPTPELERVYIHLESEGPTEGNPLKAQVELNQGPDNTPQKIDIYSGKGSYRPFRCWIETPGETRAVFIRNLGPLEFPFNAGVGTEMKDDVETSTMAISEDIFDMSSNYIVQGGAVRVYDLDHSVSHVKVIMKTDGRPLNAQVELIQGPNAPKYTIDIYTEDGLLRPFVFVMKTPGAGNSVRIVNTGTQEFPLIASVGPTTM